MKTTQIIAAAALSFIAVAGAHAENYQGVQQVNSVNSRATIEAQGVAAAHAPNQNLDRKAFVNSNIPAAYTNGSLARTNQAGL